MNRRKHKMRGPFVLPRLLHLRLPWKMLMYIAFGVMVLKVIMEVSFYGDRPWSRDKLGSERRKVSGPRKVRDLEFVAGKFLETAHPTSNNSYCHERWSFHRNLMNATGSPEMGTNGPYRVLYDVIRGSVDEGAADLKHKKGSAVGCIGPAAVTYVTHATPEFLYHIAELLGRWEGPLSVAVFAPGTDAGIAHYALSRLCRCLLPQQARRLSVHLVYHISHLPVLPESVSDSLDESERSQCGPPAVLGHPTYRTKMALAYPVNVARNSARSGARTPHIFVSDVELLPSKGLATQFCSMLSRASRKQDMEGVQKNWVTDLQIPLKIPLPQPAVSNSGGTRRLAFVVPVFEVELGEKVPETKEQLLALLASDRAFYFHRWQCVHCQKFPGIHLWMEERKSTPGNLQPLVMVRREFPYHRWEPIYIGTNREPLYSEVLTWEGKQDKMTQMHQMCLLGYRFVILDRAFLVHTPGVKRPQPPRSLRGQPVKVEPLDEGAERQKEWVRSHEKRNTHLYEMIVESMNLAHPRNPRCRS
ncbi:beta-1,4-glucuronyltransferase 1-like [Ischnura elegans]|uniref:beta-1,4-glucuronyltransferase 1-like n=1 Tax=Ischnura elegans TaxID=197161 RepID=UPI001ED8B61B|nr:beta-1,4-glucuronyltransferase 1-like [Ischnura elegans]